MPMSPEGKAGGDSSLLSSSVAAINNVDRALYDMQGREVERMKAALEQVQGYLVHEKQPLP